MDDDWDFRRTVRRLVKDHRPDAMLTFHPQRHISPEVLEACVTIFLDQITDLATDNDGSCPLATRELVRGYGMLERAAPKPIARVAIYAPAPFLDAIATMAACRLWKSLNPDCGSLKVHRIKNGARRDSYLPEYFGIGEDIRAMVYLPRGFGTDRCALLHQVELHRARLEEFTPFARTNIAVESVNPGISSPPASSGEVVI